MRQTSVTFYMPRVSNIRELDSIDPDRDWHYFRRGEFGWTAQTYIRLRNASYNVAANNVAPKSGIVVLHADDMHDLLSAYDKIEDVLIVCARGDRWPQHYADVEIVQNSRYSNGKSIFFIPYWPQPGLKERDRSRGTHISTIGYKGSFEELHPAFQSEEWSRLITGMGLRWVIDARQWKDSNQSISIKHLKWTDYSNVDLLLAVRPNTNNLYYNKPASKLINAWRAGVPALLGPEFAYRDLRRSDIDYFEVKSVRDVVESVKRLLDQPRLYTAVVQHGRKRAAEFSYEKILGAWGSLLTNVIRVRYESKFNKAYRMIPIGLRYRMRKWRAHRFDALQSH